MNDSAQTMTMPSGALSAAEIPAFSSAVESEIDRQIAKYPAERKRSALIPLLLIMQRERGWVDAPAVAYLAQRLDLETSDVWETASFYSMINLKPVGKHHIQICKTLSCKITGEPQITAYVCDRLGIKPGETTADGKFSVALVECLGSCGTAPMLQIGFDYYENLTVSRLDEILDKLT